MACRRLWPPKFLRQVQVLHPLLLRGCPHNHRSGYASFAATAPSVEQIPSALTADQHPALMEDLRQFFQGVGIATSIGVLHTLRQHYPDHTVVPTPASTGLLKLAGVSWQLNTDSEIYASRLYRDSTTASDGKAGLKHLPQLARYDYRWKRHKFILYSLNYDERNGEEINDHYILLPKSKSDLHNGVSRVIDKLITAAALHGTKIDDEIWVYDRGYWRKNHKLWQNVQASRWDQVILDEELKNNLVTDVEGFFDRKDDYISFGVPWKRGIILHGLPGNGKTISIKALMRSLACRSPQIPTLYVKSLGKSTDQDDIREIFEKARESAPCLIVFEDIDSLVTDKVKSFFLNEVDGLEGNDGIMMVGSTNYLDRLDAGISKRPSRFDRKYHFPLPATPERTHYVDYWRSKLVASNTSLELPTEISSAIANITEGFSFAYLQEALVTALLGLVQTQRMNSGEVLSEAATGDLESNPIWQAIKKQVGILRKEIQSSRKSVEDSGRNTHLSDPRSSSSVAAGFGAGR
ncbi:MAG: hypothetical protein Q9186_001550 [Xanthomendoza sp. 1 TL-2023]